MEKAYEKLAFSTKISLYFEKYTRHSHSYNVNRKPYTKDAISNDLE